MASTDASNHGVARRRFWIAGRVQGVGFRYFVLRTAEAMGVVGWVQNLRDGRVLCEAQAADEVLDRFAEGLESGPRFSRVTELHSESVGPEADCTDFRIR